MSRSKLNVSEAGATDEWLVSPTNSASETREALSPIREPHGNVPRQWSRSSPQKQSKLKKGTGVSKTRKFDPRRESVAMNKYFDQLSLGKNLSDMDELDLLNSSPEKKKRSAFFGSENKVPNAMKSRLQPGQTSAQDASQPHPSLRRGESSKSAQKKEEHLQAEASLSRKQLPQHLPMTQQKPVLTHQAQGSDPESLPSRASPAARQSLAEMKSRYALLSRKKLPGLSEDSTDGTEASRDALTDAIAMPLLSKAGQKQLQANPPEDRGCEGSLQGREAISAELTVSINSPSSAITQLEAPEDKAMEPGPNGDSAALLAVQDSSRSAVAAVPISYTQSEATACDHVSQPQAVVQISALTVVNDQNTEGNSVESLEAKKGAREVDLHLDQNIPDLSQDLIASHQGNLPPPAVLQSKAESQNVGPLSSLSANSTSVMTTTQMDSSDDATCTADSSCKARVPRSNSQQDNIVHDKLTTGALDAIKISPERASSGDEVATQEQENLPETASGQRQSSSMDLDVPQTMSADVGLALDQLKASEAGSEDHEPCPLQQKGSPKMTDESKAKESVPLALDPDPVNSANKTTLPNSTGTGAEADNSNAKEGSSDSKALDKTGKIEEATAERREDVERPIEVPEEIQAPVQLLTTPSMRLMVAEKPVNDSGDPEQAKSMPTKELARRKSFDKEAQLPAAQSPASEPVTHSASDALESASAELTCLEDTVVDSAALDEEQPVKVQEPSPTEVKGDAKIGMTANQSVCAGGQLDMADQAEIIPENSAEDSSDSEEDSSDSEEDDIPRPVPVFQFPAQLLADYSNTITPVRNLRAQPSRVLTQRPGGQMAAERSSAQAIAFADLDDSPEQASPIAPQKSALLNSGSPASPAQDGQQLERNLLQDHSPLRQSSKIRLASTVANPSATAEEDLEVLVGRSNLRERPWSASNDIRWEVDGEEHAVAPGIGGLESQPIKAEIFQAPVNAGPLQSLDINSQQDKTGTPQQSLASVEEGDGVHAQIRDLAPEDDEELEDGEEPIFAYVSASGIVTPAKVAQTPATLRKASTAQKSRFYQAPGIRSSLVADFAEADETLALEDESPDVPAEQDELDSLQQDITNKFNQALEATPVCDPNLAASNEQVQGEDLESDFRAKLDLGSKHANLTAALEEEDTGLQSGPAASDACKAQRLQQDATQDSNSLMGTQQTIDFPWVKPEAAPTRSLTECVSRTAAESKNDETKLAGAGPDDKEASETIAVSPSSRCNEAEASAIQNAFTEPESKAHVELDVELQLDNSMSVDIPLQNVYEIGAHGGSETILIAKPAAQEETVALRETVQSNGQSGPDSETDKSSLTIQAAVYSDKLASTKEVTEKVRLSERSANQNVSESNRDISLDDEKDSRQYPLAVVIENISEANSVSGSDNLSEADRSAREAQSASLGGNGTTDSCAEVMQGSPIIVHAPEPHVEMPVSDHLRLSLATERLLGSLTVPQILSEADEVAADVTEQSLQAEVAISRSTDVQPESAKRFSDTPSSSRISPSRAQATILCHLDPASDMHSSITSPPASMTSHARSSPAMSASPATENEATAGASMASLQENPQTSGRELISGQTQVSRVPSKQISTSQAPSARITRSSKPPAPPTRMPKPTLGAQPKSERAVNTNAANLSNLPRPPSSIRAPRASTAVGSSLPRLHKPTPVVPRPGPSNASQPAVQGRQAGFREPSTKSAQSANSRVSRPTQSRLNPSSGPRVMQAKESSGPSKPADKSPAVKAARLSDVAHQTPPKDRRTPDYERMLNAALANEAMAFRGLGGKVANSPADGLKRPARSTKMSAYDKHVKDWDGEPLV